MDNAEIWMDVPHYEGLYQVSNKGNIWSVRSNRLMHPSINHYGYYYVCLTNEFGKKRTERVHRLVAITFLEKPENKNVVNHKDENKLNNCVDNLEWCDIQYNINYGTRNERIAKSKTGTHHSEETKQKMHEARIKYLENWRAENA